MPCVIVLQPWPSTVLLLWAVCANLLCRGLRRSIVLEPGMHWVTHLLTFHAQNAAQPQHFKAMWKDLHQDARFLQRCQR